MLKKLKDYCLNLLYKYLVFDLQDLIALQQLQPLSTSFVPWTEASLRPSGLAKILNAITIFRCQVIVECGSGLSTLYIARLLRQLGQGHLYSIEHDSEWVTILQSLLINEGLEEYVTVITAPLVSCDLAIDNNLWYDTNIIAAHRPPEKIDLLLVDGPPAWDKARQYSRYPAVPYFQSWLADQYIIVLDDINRPGERSILRKWEKRLDLKFVPYRLDGSIAVACTFPTFTIATKSWEPTRSFL